MAPKHWDFRLYRFWHAACFDFGDNANRRFSMSTAAAQFQTDDSRTPLPLRRDTFLGVFEAIGQDLGINPNWLRIPFAALILWNPEVIIGLYLALGLVVAATRWFFPAERKAESTARAEAASDAHNEVSEERLAA
jgi:phage shock protein PspC (stress-responsive transcriptional regulator)